jgi:hypothetical protein
MKRFLFLIAGSILGTSALLKADEGRSISMIVTKSGKTYQNCRIFKQDPDGVMFSHQVGAAKVLFADMTETMRNALGYDAAKAEAYAKSVAEKYQKERDRQHEYRNLLVKARITAAELEMKRLEAYGYPSGNADGVYNSGTLDYTTIWPWGYYGNRLGGFVNYRHNQKGGYGYGRERGVFQDGPLCNSTNGNFITLPSHRGHTPGNIPSKPPLGVPALGASIASPMAVRQIPSSGR